MSTSLKRLVAPSLASLALAVLASTPAGAQAPKVFYACYVPSSGAVYRIKEPNTPTACGTSSKKGQTLVHVEFSWTDGAGVAVADHGALAGLGDDDHPQYIPAEGTRTSNAGLALVATTPNGGIPASGPGTRLMWYPGKGAIRAGYVNGSQWDDASIGNNSAAFGWNSTASGQAAFAAGVASGASGDRSTALGGSSASGFNSFAGGLFANASASYALALGHFVTASGDNSTVLGAHASTNGKPGSFVFGDASTVATTGTVNAMMDNQFVARAQGFWLGNNSSVTATAGRFLETSTGAFLSSGGTWTNSSDSAKKAGFRNVDEDDLLAKLAAMPIRTWNYRLEDSTVRHIGPTAQDFRAAFGLGDGDKAIATVDADGVSLAAIQALIRRVGQLEAQVAELLARSADAGARR